MRQHEKWEEKEMNESDNSCDSAGQEVGYQYLNTAFSGTVNPQLSGNADFPFLCSDSGTAAPLSDKEL